MPKRKTVWLSLYIIFAQLSLLANRNRSMIIFALILFAIGAGLTYPCRKELVLSWQSRHWPSTVGYICGSVSQEGISQGFTTDGTMAPTENPFRVTDWIFKYEVAGQWHQSSRYSFATDGWLGNDRYLEEGTEVKVYYCPSAPSIAVLRPGLYTPFLAGPTVIVFGLGYLIYGLCRS